MAVDLSWRKGEDFWEEGRRRVMMMKEAESNYFDEDKMFDCTYTDYHLRSFADRRGSSVSPHDISIQQGYQTAKWGNEATSTSSSLLRPWSLQLMYNRFSSAVQKSAKCVLLPITLVLTFTSHLSVMQSLNCLILHRQKCQLQKRTVQSQHLTIHHLSTIIHPSTRPLINQPLRSSPPPFPAGLRSVGHQLSTRETCRVCTGIQIQWQPDSISDGSCSCLCDSSQPRVCKSSK